MKPRHAFTLAELLVVIVVIVLLFTIVVPSFKSMVRAGIEDSSVSVISAATATARVYATRTQSFSAGSYQGAGLLVMPGGEVRIIRHVEEAVDGNGQRLVDKAPPLAGYGDQPGEDWFRLHEQVGLVGVSRGGDIGSGVDYLMPPPFAIRFNSDGTLIARRTAKGDPDNAAAFYDIDGSGKHELGTDGIDTVIAVVAFDLIEFRDAGHAMSDVGTNGELASGPAAWVKQHGRVIYLNRYTGTAITP